MEISLKRPRTGKGISKRPQKKRKTRPSQMTTANRWAGPSLRAPQERKVIDIAPFTDTVTGAAPAVYLLNGVATGDDFTDRDGRRIMMKYLFFRWSVNKNNAATIGGNFRLSIVYDKQANGAAPAYTDIFAANAALSHTNLNNRSRFQILYNEFVCLQDSQAATNGGPSCAQREMFVPLNLDTQFSGTGATVASIATGALYLVYNCDITGAGVLFKATTRVRFLDF